MYLKFQWEQTSAGFESMTCEMKTSFDIVAQN